MPSNARDVVFRFVGQNLLGAPIAGAKRDVDGLLRHVGMGLQSAIGGGGGRVAGGLLRGGLWGAAIGTAVRMLAPDSVKGVFKEMGAQLRYSLDISERIARQFGIITEHSRTIATNMHKIGQKFIAGETNKARELAAPSRKAFAELIGDPFRQFNIDQFFNKRQGDYAKALLELSANREKLVNQSGADAVMSHISRLKIEMAAQLRKDQGLVEFAPLNARDQASIHRQAVDAAFAADAQRMRGLADLRRSEAFLKFFKGAELRGLNMAGKAGDVGHSFFELIGGRALGRVGSGAIEAIQDAFKDPFGDKKKRHKQPDFEAVESRFLTRGRDERREELNVLRDIAKNEREMNERDKKRPNLNVRVAR